MNAELRLFEPTSVELNKAVHKIIQKKGSSLCLDEIHALVLQNHKWWRVSERRVAKFVKRYNAGAGHKTEDITPSTPLTPSTSLDLTSSVAGNGAENDSSWKLRMKINSEAEQNEPPPLLLPQEDSSSPLRNLLGKISPQRQSTSNASLKSSASSKGSSIGSVRSSLSMFLRRRKLKSAMNDDNNDDVQSLTLRSRSQKNLLPFKRTRANNKNEAALLADFPLKSFGGVPPTQVFQSVSAVSLEESIAIQAAIQAVLRQEESRQRYIDKMDQVTEEDDDDECYDREEYDRDVMDVVLANSVVYLDENKFWKGKKESCCCWNR
ncbi:hypothetical protein ACA910_021422 [Epithemia clementina (nom. ined.)]